jgi:tetratricopeptide (TPR) repeat protein
LETAALENSAICALLGGVPEGENEALRRLAKRPDLAASVGRIRFLEAMRQAAKRSPTAPGLLRKIADGQSAYAQKARLALAESSYLQGSAPDGEAGMRRISTQDPQTQERADYLAIFLADATDPESDAQAAKLAESFLNQYPTSQFEPQVRMKLGEILYRRGDYLGARGQFGIIVDRFSDSPLAEEALFLTAEAMSRSLEPSEMEEAIGIFEQVAKSGGSLALRARLSQAGLLNALKRPKEALGVLDGILGSKPDPELRYAVLIEKGDTRRISGCDNNVGHCRMKQVSDDASAPKVWSHQALAKMGVAWKRHHAALDYTPSRKKSERRPGFLVHKAGFDAGRLLESQKLWKEAIAVYEKIGSIEGPRAEEARARVSRLRLENFIWDTQ